MQATESSLEVLANWILTGQAPIPSYHLRSVSSHFHDVGNVCCIGMRGYTEPPAMERRRQNRTKVVLPVRMWLSTTSGKSADVQFAHTFDITATGARLGSIRTPVQA